ncbi:hypothetical protein ACT3UD_10320 [Glutamicibacter sp. 287]|uniref:hypothetical protein n=1 Tax=Glutamicibacter sp. 287 TaxID=3457732 RepID=UPI0040335D87
MNGTDPAATADKLNAQLAALASAARLAPTGATVHDLLHRSVDLLTAVRNLPSTRPFAGLWGDTKAIPAVCVGNSKLLD